MKFYEVVRWFLIFFCCEIELSQMIRFHKVVLAFYKEQHAKYDRDGYDTKIMFFSDFHAGQL